MAGHEIILSHDSTVVDPTMARPSIPVDVPQRRAEPLVPYHPIPSRRIPGPTPVPTPREPVRTPAEPVPAGR